MHTNNNNNCNNERLQRVELSLQSKEADEKTRREGDTLSMERKFLELMKRKLRKKRAIAEAARQVGVCCWILSRFSYISKTYRSQSLLLSACAKTSNFTRAL